MLLKLRQVGDPVLRENARPLTPEQVVSNPIRDLISSMRETLHDAPGVGLAAPQIGVPVQLAIIEDLPEYWTELSAEEIAARERRAVPFHVIVNPRITHSSEASAEFFEGCLSLAGFSAPVPRFQEVVVECLNEQAQVQTIRASGWYARILQHEIDHLNGTLYVDRMHAHGFATLENYKRYWRTRTSGNRA